MENLPVIEDSAGNLDQAQPTNEQTPLSPLTNIDLAKYRVLNKASTLSAGVSMPSYASNSNINIPIVDFKATNQNNILPLKPVEEVAKPLETPTIFSAEELISINNKVEEENKTLAEKAIELVPTMDISTPEYKAMEYAVEEKVDNTVSMYDYGVAADRVENVIPQSFEFLTTTASRISEEVEQLVSKLINKLSDEQAKIVEEALQAVEIVKILGKTNAEEKIRELRENANGNSDILALAEILQKTVDEQGSKQLDLSDLSDISA